MSDFEFTPIRHGSLTDRTVETMLRHIVGTGMEPGTTLPSVADLAQRLGVSRPVIREAMNALKALGVIDVATGKKATVRGLDGDVLRVYFERAVQRFDGSVREVMDVRTGVESRAAALAARNRSDKQLATLQALLVRMKAAVDAPEKFILADAAMHEEIARASGNSLIAHIVESLESALRKVWSLGLEAMAANKIRDLAVAEHEAIIVAIADRDEARAEAAMRDHILAALERIS